MTSVDLADPPAPAVPPGPRPAIAWLRIGAVVAGLILATGALWTVPELRAHWDGGTTQLSLPATFATYSQFTSTESASPGGRAIAVYEYGDANTDYAWQSLAAGANRDSYRRLTGGGESASAQPYLLAPDGSRVLFFDQQIGGDEFTLQDLTTGQESTRHSVPWRSNVGGTVQMLAWSPDGRYVAYSVPAPPPGTARAEDSLVDGQVIAQLAILDVEHDTTVLFPAIQPVFGASFGPLGTLAVQLHRTVWLGTVDGHQTGGFPLPDGADLVSAVPWSPDGARIPIRTGPGVYGFVNPRMLRPFVTSEVLSAGTLLGWRTESSVVVLASDTLTEVSLVDSRTQVLSRFPAHDRCGFFSVCRVYEIQLATGLLIAAGVRDSDPDRGLWVPLSRIGLVVMGTLLVLGIALWLHRRQPRIRIA